LGIVGWFDRNTVESRFREVFLGLSPPLTRRIVCRTSRVQLLTYTHSPAPQRHRGIPRGRMARGLSFFPPSHVRSIFFSGKRPPQVEKSHCFCSLPVWVFVGVPRCKNRCTFFFLFFFAPFVFLGSIAFNTLPVSFVVSHLWVTGRMSRFCSSMIHFH